MPVFGAKMGSSCGQSEPPEFPLALRTGVTCHLSLIGLGMVRFPNLMHRGSSRIVMSALIESRRSRDLSH
jgi:hypothetical protein